MWKFRKVLSVVGGFIGNVDIWVDLLGKGMFWRIYWKYEYFGAFGFRGLFGNEVILLGLWERGIIFMVEYLHIGNGNILEDLLEIGIFWRIFWKWRLEIWIFWKIHWKWGYLGRFLRNGDIFEDLLAMGTFWRI